MTDHCDICGLSEGRHTIGEHDDHQRLVLAENGLTLTIPVTDPKLLVSANQRIHHHQRARIVKHWREAARDAVPADWLALERVHITATFRFPTKRRRDVANLYSFVIKSAIDGAVDSGLIPGDHDEVVEGLTIRRDPANGPCAFTLTFEEIL